MLQQLIRYAEEHELVTEPGFKPKDVRWAIRCTQDGAFLGAIELGDPSQKRNSGRRFRRAPHLEHPELKRGGAGCRHFLADTAEVVALHHKPMDEKALSKLEAKHEYFLDLLEQAAEAMPDLAAAAACLRDPERLARVQSELSELGAKPGDRVTLVLEGEDEPSFPLESTAWHDWWRRFRATLAPPRDESPEGGGRQLCLASGEPVVPALTHPKIKGLAGVGGQPSGDVLSSFKQGAFRSYGFVQSENAAVSEEMASTYAAALNHLLRTTGYRYPGVKVVHWFKGQVPPEDDPLPWLHEPPNEEAAQQRVRELLDAIRSGGRPDLHDNRYYVLVLSGAAGRVMVRDWIEGEYQELLKQVETWFDHLSIVRRDGKGLAPRPKLFAVLGSLVRDLDDLPPPMITTLWRVALTGAPIPYQVLARALERVRADVLNEQAPRHARMGLLKAFHVRGGDTDMHPGLNPDHPNPAYQCGRLLAVLANLQWKALGDVGAGVVQRYYAAASATPSLVLGRLLRGAQYHLDKLEPGLRHWHDKRIAGVVSKLSETPRTLTVEEQSLFALGYYHQLAEDRSGTKTSDPTPSEETTDA